MKRYIWVQYVNGENVGRVVGRLIGAGFDGFFAYPATYSGEDANYHALVDAALAAGLEIHLWWSPLAYLKSATWRAEHPAAWDLAGQYGTPADFHWPNYADADFRDWLLGEANRLLARYPVASGLHLDVWRAPGSQCPTLELDMRDALTEATQAMSRFIRASWPEKALTVAVLSGINYGDQRWDVWVNDDLIVAFPMLYYPPGANDKLAKKLVSWRGLPADRVVPGLEVYDTNGTKEPATPDELRAQIEMCQAEGWPDFCLFDEKHLTDEQAGMLTELNGGDIVSVITELQAVEAALRQQADALVAQADADAAALVAQADAVAAQIVALQSVDAVLDEAADVIEVG